MAGPTPRSLVLDLLSTLSTGSTMPVAALLEAAALFDLAPGAIRVALARLLAAGRIERDERGRYRLGAAAAPVQSVVRGWRGLEGRSMPWDGTWWAVHDTGVGRRGPQARRHERALRLLGFRRLRPGLAVRPANLREGCAALREELQALGLSPRALVCALRELDSETDAKARALYDAPALRAAYRRTFAELEASSARLASLDPADAMRESFVVGGRAIQHLAQDPVLPPEIFDPRERDALARAMRDYDRRGRSCWAALLARYDVPHRRAPADTRVADGSDRLVA
ncbi:MAG TPA: PaaX family transcriptional regulator [Myxococcota bacterium]|jgi:phenylacetic acid degradation operon negative regulatory protein|nr:PaaX family transcriptional regulator [Myxococcota bacterium]